MSMHPFDYFSHCLKKHHINRFVVAVSGGADSMAMAQLAVQYVKANHSVVHVLIVDHKLRSESTEEATYVGKLCGDLGLPYTILTWDHPPLSKRLQERARKARYELMATWCQEHHFQYILTAHHADDVLETFMMRLFKGSSLKGLCALTPTRALYGITLVRPFLGVTRDELRATLADQSYVQDPSNDNPAFERVRIRQWLSARCSNEECCVIPAKAGTHSETINAKSADVCNKMGPRLRGDDTGVSSDSINGFLKSYEKLQQADAIIKNIVDAFAQQHIHGHDIALEPLLAVAPLLFERLMKDYIFDDFVEDAAIQQLRQALSQGKTTTLNHKKFTTIKSVVRVEKE